MFAILMSSGDEQLNAYNNSYSAGLSSVTGLGFIINDIRTGNTTITKLAINAIFIAEGIASAINVLNNPFGFHREAFVTGAVTGVLSVAFKHFFFPAPAPPAPVPQQQDGA